MPKWIDDFDPKVVTDVIEDSKRIDESGKVTYQGIQHRDQITLLDSMISLDQSIPEFEKRKLISSAVNNAASSGNISPRTVRREIAKLEKKYLNQPLKKYKLFTSVSLASFQALPSIRFDDATIKINAKFNKTARLARKNILNSAKDALYSAPPHNYLPVTVTLNARSEHEAADKAIDAFDFVRGVWNLFLNSSLTFRITTGKRYPFNKIVSGPLHTLHKTNGELATSQWWYEPQFLGTQGLYAKKSELEQAHSYFEIFRKALRKSNYKNEIITSVQRYVRALDSWDWEDSFLRLWSVLEFLTGTTYGSYKITAKRAAYHFSNRNYAYQVLIQLRNYRNKSVHTGSESNDIESFIMQLKQAVEVLINFHALNSYKFGSLDEAGEFMDLPYSKEDLYIKMTSLELQMKKVREAIKYRS